MAPEKTIGAPFTPTNPDEVLEVLPQPEGYAQIRALQKQYKDDPKTVNGYLLMDAYIKLGKQEGDPRYYGYAEAISKPLFPAQKNKPDATLLVLEANILQHKHDFDAALVMLNKVLKLEPQHPDAHLMRAVILTARGEYKTAMADCHAVLSPAYGALLGLTCVSMVDGLTGNLKTAYERLNLFYQRFGDSASRDERGWALTTLGELAIRLGDNAKAEAYFREALKSNPKDYYALAALSDLLLAANRPDEVIPLLQDYTLQDNLLLRLALAEALRQGPKRQDYIEMMQARIAAAQQRKETVHLRDYARFALQLEHEPQNAFRMAKENWKTTKEPADARILIESALAIGDKDTARDVLAWERDQGYEDVTFNPYKSL